MRLIICLLALLLVGCTNSAKPHRQTRASPMTPARLSRLLGCTDPPGPGAADPKYPGGTFYRCQNSGHPAAPYSNFGIFTSTGAEQVLRSAMQRLGPLTDPAGRPDHFIYGHLWEVETANPQIAAAAINAGGREDQ